MHILLETRIKHDFPGAAHQAIGNGWEPFLRWFYTTFAAASTTVLPQRPSRFPVVRVIHGRLSTHSHSALASASAETSAARIRMGAESMLVCGKCGDDGARPRIRRRGFDAMDTAVVPFCQECMDGELADGSRVQWAELEEVDDEEEEDGPGGRGFYGVVRWTILA